MENRVEMSLEVKKPIKYYLSKIIFAIVLIIIAAFCIRVKTWEDQYYKEKEGSERAAPEIIGDIEATEVEVSEVEVTEQERVEYVVAPDKPRYLYVDKLGISQARILEIGVNPNGQMQTPYSIFDAGWYNGSSKPGMGGTAVFDGHNGGPNVQGIFKKLNTLEPGDEIRIEMGSGIVYTYRVYDNVEVKLSEADKKMASLMTTPVPGQESISIISCIGEWSSKQKTYLSRQFLRATLV